MNGQEIPKNSYLTKACLTISFFLIPGIVLALPSRPDFLNVPSDFSNKTTLQSSFQYIFEEDLLDAENEKGVQPVFSLKTNGFFLAFPVPGIFSLKPSFSRFLLSPRSPPTSWCYLLFILHKSGAMRTVLIPKMIWL